ncbi:MAG: hypothetical protein M1820_007879 [Bogoriella megaspora]|nr:MAG: hypothetical protein M1820_007879 [Bogoriella megaspora]
MLPLLRNLQALPASLFILALTSLSYADPIPEPLPLAEPEALPAPAPKPDPKPIPIPNPIAKAEALPDGGGNVYQFSGAIYYGSGSGSYQSQGGSYQSAAPAVCPSDHPTSCTNIGEPSWCCPSGNTCGWASNQVVGCCPDGETCSGTIGGYNQGGPTSTVYSAPPTTTYYSNPGTTVVVQSGAATTQYLNPGTTTAFSGFCTTIIAHGPGLPTEAAAGCGTALVVAEANAIARVGTVMMIGMTLGGILVTWKIGGLG